MTIVEQLQERIVELVMEGRMPTAIYVGRGVWEPLWQEFEADMAKSNGWLQPTNGKIGLGTIAGLLPVTRILGHGAMAVGFDFGDWCSESQLRRMWR